VFHQPHTRIPFGSKDIHPLKPTPAPTARTAQRGAEDPFHLGHAAETICGGVCAIVVVRINLVHVPQDMRNVHPDRTLTPSIVPNVRRPPRESGLFATQGSSPGLLAARAGRVTTAVLVLTSVVVVAAFLVLSWRGTPKPQTVSVVPPVPDITQLPTVSGGKALNNVGVGEGLFISIADKRDPTRVAGQLLAARSTPLEGKRYQMEEPKVWIYLRDGRTVYFEAQSGRALLPDLAGSRPEDGVIKGNVRGRMFAPTPGGERPDPATATPILTLQTQELTFDMRVGEVRFPGDVTLKGDRVDFAGTGCLLVLTEGEQQLDQLRIERTSKLTIYPEPRTAKPEGTVATAPGVTPNITPPATPNITTPASGMPAPATVDEVMYAITLDDNVTIRKGQRWLMAHRLESFIRLIDNTLPEREAVAGAPLPAPTYSGSARNRGFTVLPAVYSQPADNKANKPADPPRGSSKRNSTKQAGKGGKKAPIDVSQGDEPIELMFDGVLEARMVRQMPEQLRASDAWVRAVGDEKTYITLGDDGQGLVATAAAAWYSTTQRLAGLLGSQEKPAIVSKVGSGAAAGESFEINQRTGLVLAGGQGWLESQRGARNAALTGGLITSGPHGSVGGQPGVAGVPKPAGIEAIQEGAGAVNRLTWSRRAEFNFGLVEGAMTSRLDSAQIEGSVRATAYGEAQAAGGVEGASGAGGLEGEVVAATFAAIDDQSSYLRTLDVRGAAASPSGPAGTATPVGSSEKTGEGSRARAYDGKGSKVEADVISVQFERGVGTQSDPSVVEASGTVVGAQKDARMSAGRVRAQIARVTEGPGTAGVLRATDVLATEDVTFTRGDGVSARSPRLTARPVEQIVILSGPGSTVAQRSTSIGGNTVTMNGLSRTIAVEGAGEFKHVDEQGGRTADASWSRGMTYDDSSGLLTCLGNARAVMATGQSARDTLVAQSVRVAIEKAPAYVAPTDTPNISNDSSVPEQSAPPKPARRVLWALAEGAHGEPGAQVATVEVRRYSLTSPGTLERLMFIEGATIRADNERGRLDVPTPGKLLTLDRSGGGDVQERGPAGELSAKLSSKGTALFTWNESMSFDRTTGEATFLGQGPSAVRLVHQASGGERAELECKVLTAFLDVASAGGTGETLSGEFRSAKATGMVWLRASGRELTADVLEYVAATRVAEASSVPGNLVMVSNPGSAAPTSAASMTWNLSTDSISVRNAQPMTIPR
jgi:hypothetical protein